MEGELSYLDDPAKECGFKLNISAEFDPNKVARSGSCPSMIVQQYGCFVLLIFPQDTGGNPWVYNRASPMMVVKKTNADAAMGNY